MKRNRILMAMGMLLMVGGTVAGERQLFERLRIDHAAMVSAERDFHRQRRAGSLNGTEATDYAAYVARLHRLVAEDCVALSTAGLPQPPDLGCPLLPPPMFAPAAIDQAGEQTADEQIAALDAELLSGLGEFDEMLLREQERVRITAPTMETAGGSAGGAEGKSGATTVGGGAGGAEGKSGAASARDSEGNAGQGAGSGSGAQHQRGRQKTPPDIPDGSDDDVVARQLREAAEKERDPELKKRLWEEYRRYKAGTR